MSPKESEQLNAEQRAANPKLGTKQKMLSSVAQLAPWPTPIAGDWKGQKRAPGKGKAGMLCAVAKLAPWGTPNTMDSMESRNLEERKKKGGCSNLKDQASLLAGWGTPTTTDKGSRDGRDTKSRLGNQARLV
jgi:hypothetical protein